MNYRKILWIILSHKYDAPTKKARPKIETPWKKENIIATQAVLQ